MLFRSANKPGYEANNFYAVTHEDPNKRILPSEYSRFQPVTQALHGIPSNLMAQRDKLFADNNIDNNCMSAGCINARRRLLDNAYFNDLNQANLYVLPRLDNKKSKKKKMGGEPCYNCGGMYDYGGPTKQNDTYSAGVSYGSGGTYVPNPAESAYGLPQFMYDYGGVPGMPTMDDQNDRMMGNDINKYANQMFFDRGQDFIKEGLESLMTKKPVPQTAAYGGVQNLHDAGYNLQYLSEGGPRFSDITLYPHQAYVPAYDWMAYGGPTYSNVTQYNHQQYVPAFDWMAQGGLVKGSVHDVSEDDVQYLINQGYKIEYL